MALINLRHQLSQSVSNHHDFVKHFLVSEENYNKCFFLSNKGGPLFYRQYKLTGGMTYSAEKKSKS